MIRIELDIEGMTCASCAQHVEAALASVPGVEAVEVPGWESGRARVTANPDVSPAAVEKAGYIARITFTDPQIASAGLTEQQAAELGYADGVRAARPGGPRSARSGQTGRRRRQR